MWACIAPCCFHSALSPEPLHLSGDRRGDLPLCLRPLAPQVVLRHELAGQLCGLRGTVFGNFQAEVVFISERNREYEQRGWG